jgi:signal transduction histidine kinase
VIEAALVDRLAAHRTLRAVPREQLEWLAAHGKLRRITAGEVVVRPGDKISELYVVLEGHFSIRVDQGDGPRKILEWGAGDVGGLLPFSRMQKSPGTSTVDEDGELLMVSSDCFPEMIARCQEITAALVHTMVDRARRFTSSGYQVEKMVSLGRLAAGLAHELNNPASALARTSGELGARAFELEASALALGAIHLSAEQLSVVAAARARCDEQDGRATLSPLERADREDEVADWVGRHGSCGVRADEFAETPLTVEQLDGLAASLGDEALGFALRSLVAGFRTRTLCSEVESAAKRIHKLVAAIKGFSYMDQSRVPKPVDIGRGLTDTLAVLGAKARGKSVAVSLDVADDLPMVEGLGGELNQVWENLISNAIDAVPESGRIVVKAVGQPKAVVVSVVDDGPGIPAEILERIFEPFFTTKPMGSGTGLGLDIARRIVREHEGQLEVESRPGRTEFRVTLPYQRPKEA